MCLHLPRIGDVLSTKRTYMDQPLGAMQRKVSCAIVTLCLAVPSFFRVRDISTYVVHRSGVRR